MADLTRKEQFLNHIAHPDEPCPAPQTREEFLLKEIADNKGGGGGGGLHITLDVETDEEDNNIYSNPSHTWEQILAAYNSGTYMFLTLNQENGTSPVFHPEWVEAGGPYPVYMIQFAAAGGGWAISFDADGGIQ